MWRQWPSQDRSVGFDQEAILDDQLSLVFEAQPREQSLTRDGQQMAALTHTRRNLHLLAQGLLLPQADEQEMQRQMQLVIEQDRNQFLGQYQVLPVLLQPEGMRYQIVQPEVDGQQGLLMKVWLWRDGQRLYKVSVVHDQSEQAQARAEEFLSKVKWQGQAVQIAH